MALDVLARRPLGRTAAQVTALCVGTGELGNIAVYDPVGHAQAVATAHRNFAGPLNFVDTSNGYGSSEMVLGEALREIGGVPEGLLLATKVDPKSGGAFDGARVRESVQESRERLGLDHLPLLHLHDPERISFDDAMTPGGPVEVMRQLVDEGVVGSLGVAGGPVDLMRRFVDTGIFDVVLTHNRWTLLDRSAEPLLADATAAGVAVLNAAPFGGGILAKGPDAVPQYCYRPASAAILAAARAIEAACARHGVPLAAAALQDSLRESRITSTVVGWSRPTRYDETLALAAYPIPDELWDELAELTPARENWLGER